MKLSKTNRRLMAALLCGALILGSGALPTKVDAASSSEIQGQIDELQRKSDEFDAQLSELEQQKNANLDDINALIDEKMRLDKEVFLLYSQIDNMNEQIAAYGVMIADQQQKLDEATARYRSFPRRIWNGSAPWRRTAVFPTGPCCSRLPASPTSWTG